jgi:excisionase family DNA binding protein
MAPADCPFRGAKMRKFVTIDQVADALNVSARTVRRWIEDRKLVAHPRYGSRRAISPPFWRSTETTEPREACHEAQLPQPDRPSSMCSTAWRPRPFRKAVGATSSRPLRVTRGSSARTGRSQRCYRYAARPLIAACLFTNYLILCRKPSAIAFFPAVFGIRLPLMEVHSRRSTKY